MRLFRLFFFIGRSFRFWCSIRQRFITSKFLIYMDDMSWVEMVSLRVISDLVPFLAYNFESGKHIKSVVYSSLNILKIKFLKCYSISYLSFVSHKLVNNFIRYLHIRLRYLHACRLSRSYS